MSKEFHRGLAGVVRGGVLERSSVEAVVAVSPVSVAVLVVVNFNMD